MALRRNIDRKSRSRLPGIISFLIVAALISAVGIAAFILYFNGQNVRSPLLKLLNERSGFTFNIDQVEFSPIYPNILKLHDISFNKSRIGELYIEYDVKSLIAGSTLKIKDLYVRDLEFRSDDYARLKQNCLGFSKLQIDHMSVINVPINLGKLTVKSSDLYLQNVSVAPGADLDCSRGTFIFRGGFVDGLYFNRMAGTFAPSGSTLQFTDFEIHALGGSASGDFILDPGQQSLKFSRLSLNKLVLKDPEALLSRYSFSADRILLNDLAVLVSGRDFYFGGISGTVRGFSNRSSDQLNFSFDGEIYEISRPIAQLNALENQVRLGIADGSVDFSGSGKFQRGSYRLNLTYNARNNELNIRDAFLRDTKIEFDETQLQQFSGFAQKSRITVRSLDFRDVELLSFVNSLPLSVRSFSGSLSGLKLQQGRLEGNPAGSLSLRLKSSMYSDLYFENIDLIANISDAVINFNIPELRLRRSRLSMAGSLDKHGEQSYLTLSARDFDIAELNSNLIPHLLNGKISAEVDLKSSGSTPEELKQHLQGYVEARAAELLISHFGLDLLNGGPKEDRRLSLETLLYAISGSDCGIYDLDARADVNEGHIGLQGTFSLATSTLNLHGRADLNSGELSGRAVMLSLPRDSITAVYASGTLDQPEFRIKALLRGEARPGLPPEQALNPSAAAQKHRRHLPPPPQVQPPPPALPPPPPPAITR